MAFDTLKDFFSAKILKTKKPKNSIGHVFLSRVMWSGCSTSIPKIDIYYTVIYVLASGLIEPGDLFLSCFPIYIQQHLLIWKSQGRVSLKVEVNNKGICIRTRHPAVIV